MPTFDYPYDTPLDYTYDSDEIEVAGGIASLKQDLTNVYARWHLNESTGTNCPDDGGSSRDGTGQNIGAPNWVTGKLNNCLTLNGTNEYVDCGAIASFERTQPFSCAAWVKTTDVASTDINIVTKGGGANLGWAFTYHPSAGSLEVNLVNTAATNLITVTVTGIGATISSGAWHFVAFTYDGSSTAAGVKIYLDGVLQTMNVINNTLSATIISGTNCQIAAQNALNLWGGDVDEVVIWDMEITGPNVTWLWNTGTGREEWYYYTTSPTIEPTDLLNPSNVVEWTAFTETLGGGNEGTVSYTVYKNTKNHEYYWTGSAWSTGGSSANSNTDTEIDDNIDTLDVSPQGIGFVAYLTSNGVQKVEIDLNSISYDQADASIQPTDIHLYESENMTDTGSSGGPMSNTQIACGTMNNIFPNISRLDRLYGRVQFRKIYAKVDSENLDTYSGAHIAIKEIPFDENVSIMYLPAADAAETRDDLMPEMESFYEIGEIAGDAELYSAASAGNTLLVFHTILVNRIFTAVGLY